MAISETGSFPIFAASHCLMALLSLVWNLREDSVLAKGRKRGAPPLYECHAPPIIRQDVMSMRTVVFHASHMLIRP